MGEGTENEMKVKGKGKCDAKDEVKQKDEQDPETCMSDCSKVDDNDPTCDSNGKEYPNKCKFWNAVCASGGTLKKKPCGKKDLLLAANDPETCMSDCSKVDDNDPTCDSNGKKYPNKCKFWNAVCASGGILTKKPCPG